MPTCTCMYIHTYIHTRVFVFMCGHRDLRRGCCSRSCVFGWGRPRIQANGKIFAAIRADGSVVTWGNSQFGADISEVQEQLRDVQQLQAAEYAFAAIRADGTVVTWGKGPKGGDSSGVQDQLHGVRSIQKTKSSFAALRADGSVVTWGDDGGNSSAVQDQLRNVIPDSGDPMGLCGHPCRRPACHLGQQESRG